MLGNSRFDKASRGLSASKQDVYKQYQMKSQGAYQDAHPDPAH